MAQTGYTPILIYSSSTGGNTPAAGNLTNSTLGSELAINITDGKLFYKDNANAIQVIGWKTTPTTAGGTGLTSYTAGDLLYFATGTTLSKLAIGASTTILTSSGTAPQWSAASGITVGTATNIAGGAAGSVPYQTGAGATSLLAIGTAYYMLGVNAGGTAPSWQPSSTSTLTTQGDLLYASAANTLARLAKNTTASRYLSNSGTSNNPAWAQVDLTNGVTGTLPVGNGGTGLASYTANRILYASGTSTIATSAGLTFDGTNFATTGSSSGASLIATTSGVKVTGGPTGYGGDEIAMQTGGANYSAISTQLTGGTFYCDHRGTNSTADWTWRNGTGGANTRMNLSGTGDLTLSTGNLIQGTAAKGINFTANTATAGKTSQLLNAYEEGTWTPAPNSGTFSSKTGQYVRVGRMVTLFFNITVGTGGATSMTGNPYTTYGSTGAVAVSSTLYTEGQTYPAGATTAQVLLGGGGSTISFVGVGSTLGFTSMTLTASAVLIGSITFII